MAEIGKAYVQIVPSAKGIKSGLESVLGGPLDDVGKKTGATLSGKMLGGMRSVGAGMTRYITKPALGVAAALTGATLFSGWKRMTEIDNAKVKLEAIGNTTKDVKSITESALKSVKGTAYGMNEAMTASASAVAAGVKPGKDLTKYLTAIGDAAAVAGVDMNDMGYIFNSVATKNKASNKELKEMANRGIPIYQYLADELGVTADKVFDLAKHGEIDLKTFQNAVTNHIGGAAKEIGSKTITGAIANLRASMSRIGANFLGSADDKNSLAGKILPMLNNLMDSLEPVEEKAKEWGSTFADAVTKVVDAVSKMPPGMIAGIFGGLVAAGPSIQIGFKAFDMFSKLSLVIKPLMGGSTGLAGLGKIITTIGAKLGILAGPVGIAIAAFAALYMSSEQFRNAVNSIVQMIFGELQKAFTAILPSLKVLGSAFVDLGKFALQMLSQLGDAFAPLLQELQPLIQLLVQIILGRAVMAFKVLAVAVKALVPILKLIIWGISAAIAAIALLAAGAVKGFKALSKSATSAMKRLQKVLTWGNIVKAAQRAWKSIRTAVVNQFNAVSNKVKSIVKTVRNTLSFSGLAGKVRGVWNRIKDAIGRPIEAAKNKVSGIVDRIRGLFPLNIGNVFSGLKLPHFSVSGGKAPFGIGGKGSLPKMSVQWYAKGAIIKDATLIGAGERGAEAIVPLKPFWDKLEATKGGNVTNNYNFGDITLDAHDLDDVATVEDLVDVLRRAKAFA